MSASPRDWQTSCTSLSQRGTYLLESGLESDCSFMLGSKIFKTHRLVLAMASPVFYAMFYGGLPVEDPIGVTDIEPTAFETLLKYIYTDAIDLSSSVLCWDVYRAAQKYTLPHLMEQCTSYIMDKVTFKNACLMYERALLYNNEKLKHKCEKISAPDSSEHISQGAEQTPPADETAATVPASDHQYADTGSKEGTGFLALREAIRNIRFLTLTAEQFANVSEKTHLLTEEEKLSIIRILQPGSAAKEDLPSGFTTSTELRNKKFVFPTTEPQSGAVEFEISVDKDEELVEQLELHGMPWNVTVDNGGDMWLVCEWDAAPYVCHVQVSIDAKATVGYYTQEVLRKKIKATFTSKKNKHHCLSREDLVDEMCMSHVEDSEPITVEVQVTAEAPRRL